MKRKRDRSGMTILEVLVALSILSLVLISLGTLMFTVARQSRRSALATYRAAASTKAAALVQLAPFDSIDNYIGCTSDSSGFMQYNRCVTVSTISANRKQVTVVVQPTGDWTTTPDTQVIQRTRSRKASPLWQ